MNANTYQSTYCLLVVFHVTGKINHNDIYRTSRTLLSSLKSLPCSVSNQISLLSGMAFGVAFARARTIFVPFRSLVSMLERYEA